MLWRRDTPPVLYPMYVHTMGRAFAVTALADNDEDANRHMNEADNHDAVLTVLSGLVVMVDKDDMGRKL